MLLLGFLFVLLYVCCCCCFVFVVVGGGVAFLFFPFSSPPPPPPPFHETSLLVIPSCRQEESCLGEQLIRSHEHDSFTVPETRHLMFEENWE